MGRKIIVESEGDPMAEPIELVLSGKCRPLVAANGTKPRSKAAAAKAGEEPGTELTKSDVWHESFFVLADPPSAIIDEFLSMASSSGVTTVWSQVSLLSFLRLVMLDDDNAERFDALCRDRDRLFDTRAMVRVVNQLIPVYARFPTGGPGA